MVTNLLLDLVVAANCFSSLCPRVITFRGGVAIAAVLSVLSCPSFLAVAVVEGTAIVSAVGTLFSGVIGIMIADYYLVNRQSMDVDELSYPRGCYWFSRGFNPHAFLALLLALLANLPGLLATFGVLDVPILRELFSYSWWIGMVVGGVAYALLMRFVATRFYAASELTQMQMAEVRKSTYGELGSVYGTAGDYNISLPSPSNNNDGAAATSSSEHLVSTPEVTSWKLKDHRDQEQEGVDEEPISSMVTSPEVANWKLNKNGSPTDSTADGRYS